MYMYVDMFMYMYCTHPGTNTHVNSFKETRQSKATTPEDNSFFLKRKNELHQAGFKPTTFCVLGRHYTN